MNAYLTHAILMPIVMTPKVPLCVNAILGILEMVLIVLVSIFLIAYPKDSTFRCHYLHFY